MRPARLVCSLPRLFRAIDFRHGVDAEAQSPEYKFEDLGFEAFGGIGRNVRQLVAVLEAHPAVATYINLLRPRAESMDMETMCKVWRGPILPCPSHTVKRALPDM